MCIFIYNYINIYNYIHFIYYRYLELYYKILILVLCLFIYIYIYLLSMCIIVDINLFWRSLLILTIMSYNLFIKHQPIAQEQVASKLSFECIVILL